MRTPLLQLCRRGGCARTSKLLFVSICSVSALIILVNTPIFKPWKTPWTAVKWCDEDFSLQAIKKDEIVILRWTKYWQEYIYASPQLYSENDECSYVQNYNTNCRLTYDRRYLNRSNAVVFHMWDLIFEEIPPYHPQNQFWIYLNHESPVYKQKDMANMAEYYNTFNWTMTYRQDSDVYDPYGLIVQLSPDEEQNVAKSLLPGVYEGVKRKSKTVAWIVSKCVTPGKREDFVEELKKHIQVDVYGKCGDFKCTKSGVECYADIALEYKFYLAFENSLCVDYVTEKFWSSLQNNIVPVVFGGADYSSIAPYKSFINARDFKSPRHLAEYLKYLDRNETEYLSYLDWKSKYKVVRGRGWCKLCQAVGDHVRGNQGEDGGKWYEDVDKWWKSRDTNSGAVILKESESNWGDKVNNGDNTVQGSHSSDACEKPMKNPGIISYD